VASPVLDPAEPDKPLSAVSQISVGYLHACALLEDGTARCWGNNELGQLGDGGGELRSPVPRVVLGPDGAAPLSDIVQVAAGYSHSCALKVDGTAYCWGDDRYGELGQAPPLAATFSALPLAVQDVGNAVAGITRIQAGWEFSCALMSDRSARCFGNGQRGERGDGANGPTHYGSDPVAVVDASRKPAAGILSLAPGFHALCLRDAFSAAICAGENEGLNVFGPEVSVPSAIRW
jgi:alpha-tubulin suppressor-like RCC1 family protein